MSGSRSVGRSVGQSVSLSRTSLLYDAQSMDRSFATLHWCISVHNPTRLSVHLSICNLVKFTNNKKQTYHIPYSICGSIVAVICSSNTSSSSIVNSLNWLSDISTAQATAQSTWLSTHVTSARHRPTLNCKHLLTVRCIVAGRILNWRKCTLLCLHTINTNALQWPLTTLDHLIIFTLYTW